MGAHCIKEAIAGKLDPDRTIGVGLHGDSAPTTKQEGLLTIAWNSTIATGSTKDTRNIFTVVPKSIIEDGPLLAVWEYMTWAFNALLDGRVPERDHRGIRRPDAGRRLAGGWTFAVVQLRGDREFYSEYVRLPRWDSKPFMCWQCYAQQGDGVAANMSWTSTADGGWRDRLRTHEEWVAELTAAGLPLPAIMQIVSLRLEGIMADVLHAVDQGVAFHLIGNAWWELEDTFGAPRDTQARRVALLEIDAKKWHKDNSVEWTLQGKLTEARVRTSSDWPKLKAKGAATRHLIDYTVHLAASRSDGSRHDRMRLAVCQLLKTFYDTCEREGRYLGDDAKATLRPLGKRFMRVYVNLSAEALAAGLRAWKIVPKFHVFEHICADQVG